MRLWIALSAVIIAGCGGPAWPEPPPDFGSADQVSQGRSLFLEHCAICHGENADGVGQRHSSLSSEPPNFNEPSWQHRRTAGHVFTIIHDGKQGTSMPAWVGKLSDDEIWAIAAFVKSLDTEAP
jgi:mono/diheme cytochrome c family protein